VETTRSSLKEKEASAPLLTYRSSDEKLHPISIESFEEKMGITYSDHLHFDSTKTIELIAKKCARKMKQKKLRQMNDWILALYGKAMEKSSRDFFYIRWINRYLGYGIFAARTLPALTYIGEYAGEVKKRNNRDNRHNDYVFSYDLCGKATRYCIDAKKKGNFTRFLNHSESPNLTSRWVIKEEITHIIFFSNQTIPKGRQLTYCYGPWYWRSRSHPSSL